MRLEPEKKYRHQPEIVVCVETAKNDVRPSIYNRIEIPAGMKANGYLTAIKANKYIRAQLPVLKKKDFHGERPKPKNFLAENNMRCCVCVDETFVYAKGHDYWSFIDHDDGLIKAAWYIRDCNNRTTNKVM